MFFIFHIELLDYYWKIKFYTNISIGESCSSAVGHLMSCCDVSPLGWIGILSSPFSVEKPGEIPACKQSVTYQIAVII